jgi:hypothetical protein
MTSPSLAKRDPPQWLGGHIQSGSPQAHTTLRRGSGVLATLGAGLTVGRSLLESMSCTDFPLLTVACIARRDAESIVDQTAAPRSPTRECAGSGSDPDAFGSNARHWTVFAAVADRLAVPDKPPPLRTRPPAIRCNASREGWPPG